MDPVAPPRTGSVSTMSSAASDTVVSAEVRAAALRDQARALLTARQPKAAQAALRRALVLTPCDAATAVNLATLRPTPRAVAAAMARGAILAPAHPGVLANLATAHAAAAECPRALATWRRLAVLSPANSRAALGLTRGWIAGPDRRRRWHGDVGRGADWLYRGALVDPSAAIPVDFLSHLAWAVKAAGLQARAVRLLRAALARQPGDAKGHATLGMWLCDLRSWSAARPFLKRYLVLNPTGNLATQTLERLGHTYGHSREYSKAYLQFSRVLTLTPSRYLALLPHISNAALSRPLTPKTERLARLALVSHPSNSVIYKNFGSVMCEAGHLESSAVSSRRATIINPRIDVRVDLGTYMLRKGRPFAAWAYFDAAVSACPDNQVAVFNHAKTRLALGDDMGGIHALRARWRVTSLSAPHQIYPEPTLPLPVWQGQPVDGKRFFVWGEQGIGDDIWFAGRLNDLVSAGARVVFECSPKIAGLMARSFPRIEVRARSQDCQEMNGFDYQLPIGFLTEEFHHPGALYPSGYLRVDERLKDRLRDRYTDQGRRLAIGIAWRSVKPITHRSFEAPILDWGPLLRQKQFNFISLQYGDTAADLAAAARAFDVEIRQDPEIDYDGDLQAAAAQVAAVDAVVSIASAPVILAHGLGQPTWAALRRSQEDWRYRVAARHSFWLPHCRMFWPRASEDWQEVLTAIGADVRQCLVTRQG